MGRFMNVLVLVVLGIMLADMISNAGGTKAVFDGIGGIWKTSVSGLLGKSPAS